MKFHRSSLAAIVAMTTLAACSTTTTEDGGGEGGLEGPGINAASKTITIGEITALSGPAEIVGAPVHNGLETYLSWLNDNGGIDGWKIDLNTKDSAYNPQKTVQLFNEMKDDIAVLTSLGTPTTAAIRPAIDQEKLVTGGAGIEWADDPQLALLGTPYSPQVANLVTWLVEEKGASNAEVAIFYQNDAMGASGIDGYNAALAEVGISSAAEVNYKPGDTDFSSQAAKLKSSGADYVVVVGIAAAASTLIGTAASLEYQPTWVFPAPIYDPLLITSDGTADGTKTPVAPAIIGHAYAVPFATPYGGSSSAPGFADLVAAHDKYMPDAQISQNYTFGWALGKVYAAILEKAIENGDLSRDGILEAKTSLGEVDLEGLVSNPTYSDDSAEPPSRVIDIAEVDATSPDFLKVIATGVTSEAAAEVQPAN